MTTTSEWQEIMEWIGARFPDRPWAAEQAVAYFHDLEDYDATDVWTALFALYEDGQRFAPNGSQLLYAARTARRIEALDDLYRRSDRALPEPIDEADRSKSWDEFSTKRLGEVLTPTEYVARLHAASTKCRNTTCDIHHPLSVHT